MEKQTIDAIIDLIQKVGFPVVVAGWLLWRTDKRLERIADGTESNGRLLARLVGFDEEENHDKH